MHFYFCALSHHSVHLIFHLNMIIDKIKYYMKNKYVLFVKEISKLN